MSPIFHISRQWVLAILGLGDLDIRNDVVIRGGNSLPEVK